MNTPLSLRSLCFGLAVLLQLRSANAADTKINFDRDVRPILSNHCYACHGPDAKALQGELKLSERADALVPAESGKVAIVPGKPEASELVRRVFATDDAVSMPPAEFKKTLSDAQRQTLKKWIEQGAEYTPH